MKAKTSGRTRKPDTVKVGDVVIKIYKRTRPTVTGGTRTIWEVANYVGGRRRLQSFSDQTAARDEAQRIGRLLSSGESTAANFRGTDAASYGRAVEILRNAGLDTPLELVASMHVEAVKILGSEKIVEAAKEYIRRNPVERPLRTVRQVADEMIEVKAKRKASERYLQDLRYQLNKLCEKFPANVDTVTTGDLQLWFDRLDAAPRTIRNLRSAAAVLFRFAESRCYIGKGDNPAIATERIKAKNGDDVEIYTPDEVARLLAAAPDSIRPAMAIQAFTGIRTAELMRLDWRAVKLERGHIEITAANAKTASRRIVPTLPNLVAWLKFAANKTSKIFPRGAHDYHELMRETASNTKTEKLPAVELKHNALRHSFISYRVAQTQNVAQVALEAGNSPAMIFGHYRELVTADDAKAWFAIEPKAAK
ncbi:MAG TPA: tyrosine-type recombinase/integrase [Verrucomicrobiae bacterium]|nr:tyrosine-type recombinase/integrase [Verrucomicrobiae bacterium]